MKIVLINSSGRKNGNTAEILGIFKRALDDGLSVAEYIHLTDYTVKTCRGCRVCFDRGEENCPLKDDLLAIHTKLEWADIVIFGSPVYVEDVNGDRKSVV